MQVYGASIFISKPSNELDFWWFCSESNRGFMDYEPSPLTSEVQNQVYTKGRQSGE